MGLFDSLFGRKAAATPADTSADGGSSEAHLLLLSKFLVGQQLQHMRGDYWAGPLGEPAEIAIHRFIENGSLVPAPLEAKLESRFKASDLKPLLKERGLKVSGRKPELIERLVAADQAGMSAMVADMEVYECSPEARSVAEQYKLDQAHRRAAVEDKVLTHLRAREFEAASRTVAEFEAGQVFQRGLGMDWSRHDCSRDVRQIEVMFEIRPRILDGLPAADWGPLRVAAGMMALWGTNRAKHWLPEGFVGVEKFDADTAARMILFAANHQMRLEEYRALSGSGLKVKEYQVSATADSCPVCKAMAGKRYSLDRLPVLPHPDCAHPYGCRCMAMPVFM